MNAYIRLMRLDKPIGSLLLLWPTYWALFLSADGWPDLRFIDYFHARSCYDENCGLRNQ